jgi:hypothetical protein
MDTCPYCGTAITEENPAMRCPQCGRDGCLECMPAGVGCICPECEEDSNEDE